MKVEFHRRFAKDLANISAAEVLGKIREVILQLEESDDLRDLSQIKTLKGGGGYLKVHEGMVMGCLLYGEYCFVFWGWLAVKIGA